MSPKCLLAENGARKEGDWTMTEKSGTTSRGPSAAREFLVALLVLMAVIAVIFYRSFIPGQALFANDGNLGITMAHADEALSSIKGSWQELNLLGLELPSASPNVDFVLFLLLGPILSAKFTAALSLVAVGMCCWFFFRVLGFPNWVCILGGLSTALNSNIFSNTCWGLFLWTFARGFVFLALAAVYSASRGGVLPKLLLAGFAVGMGILQGYDIGAIFSLYVAAFTAFVALTQPGSWGSRIGRAVGRVALVAVAAAFIAAHGLMTLIGTQIVGVADVEEQTKSSEEQWTFATQWSLPKIETLRLIIPGLFGYRMEMDNGGDYWGTVGQSPGWFEHHQGYPRHSGEGEYAGILIVLIAAWAGAHVWRKKGSPYSEEERRMLAFWVGAAVISLLMAFGRHAPFYRLYYSLPFFSTMRNPIKFLQPLNISLLILFGYGLAGMGRLYLERSTKWGSTFLGHMKNWWSAVGGFDKRWALGCLAFLGCSLMGWLIFTSSRTGLLQYLEAGAFAPDKATAIFSFSSKEIGLYLVFLVVALGLMSVIMSGWLAGKRLRWAVLALGLFIGIDMVRANGPWIKYYDYREKYASNPVIDFLREKPHEYRVEIPHVPMAHTPIYIPLPQELSFYVRVCFVAWLEHLFQYYKIQSMAINQNPRQTIDYKTYFAAFSSTNFSRSNPNPVRLWELCNSRYFLTVSGVSAGLNQQLDPTKQRFKDVMAFNLKQRSEDIYAVETNATGPFALVEFTGALPRAKLFSRWINSTNDMETLVRLTDPAFDPAQMVFVASDLPKPSTNAPTGSPEGGKVTITRYESKRVLCSAQVESPSLLLLNDKYHPNWKVRVDGKPDNLLRCNYIVRGVYLLPGSHEIEFRFESETRALSITLAAMAIGLLLCGWVAWGAKRQS
ncbi:MAG TPA: hypothetical protein P5186_07630 [Candidatus Paceibacterota bacterium]|nr:hypothetical protein [Candidatus Paceibacterota bacterium]